MRPACSASRVTRRTTRTSGCSSTSAPPRTTASCGRPSSDGRLGEIEPILTGIPNGFIHDGGRLVFGPDGKLYVSTGETGAARPRPGPRLARRQDPADHPGRRPGAGQPRSRARRSGPGATATCRGWPSTTTAGCGPASSAQNTWDELNLIEKGGNYGWPVGRGQGRRARSTPNPQVAWRTDEASPSGLAFRRRPAVDGRPARRAAVARRRQRPTAGRRAGASSSATTAGCAPSSSPPTATSGSPRATATAAATPPTATTGSSSSAPESARRGHWMSPSAADRANSIARRRSPSGHS